MPKFDQWKLGLKKGQIILYSKGKEVERLYIADLLSLWYSFREETNIRIEEVNQGKVSSVKEAKQKVFKKN